MSEIEELKADVKLLQRKVEGLMSIVMPHINEVNKSEPDPCQIIIQYICERYNISYTAIQSGVRKREIVDARHKGMNLMAIYTKKSLKAIGLYYGGRDHSTIINAQKKHNDFMDMDKHYRIEFNHICTDIEKLLGINEPENNS